MVTPSANPTPPTHGAGWVALSSFGTVLGVTIALCAAAAWLGAPTIVWMVLTSAIIHSVMGLLLWQRGWYRLATTLGAAGLLFAGMVSHLYTGSVGGLTGTLLLASVITAGGLLGWRAALLDSVAVIGSLALAIYAGPAWREWMGVTSMDYVLPESLLLVFFSSTVTGLIFSLFYSGIDSLAFSSFGSLTWVSSLAFRSIFSV